MAASLLHFRLIEHKPYWDGGLFDTTPLGAVIERLDSAVDVLSFVQYRMHPRLLYGEGFHDSGRLQPRVPYPPPGSRAGIVMALITQQAQFSALLATSARLRGARRPVTRLRASLERRP